MGVVHLEKVRLFGVRGSQDSFLEELQKLGTVEVRKLEESLYRKVKLESETILAKLERIIPVLEEQLHLGLSEQLKIHTISESEFFSKQNNLFSDNSYLVEKIDSVYQEILNGQVKVAELSEQLSILEVLKNLDIPLATLQESIYLSSLIGRIETSSLKNLQRITAMLPFDFDVISTSGEFTYIVGFYYKPFARNVLEELKLLAFQEWSGPVPKEGSFKYFYQNLSTQHHQLVQKLTDLNIQLRIFAQDIHGLHMFYDYLSNRVIKDLIQFQTVESPFLFEIEGYTPSHSIPALQALVDKFPGCDYEKTELEEGEELPSLIENAPGVRNFEFVTDMYSRPGKDDIDPTPFFAPFFAVFVGIAIGDAGQGIILILLSYFVRYKTRLSDSIKKLFGICFYGGLMTVVVGVLTGTYFAIPFEKFGVEIPYLYKPEDQVMLALSISFVCGFIHLIYGYFIKFFHLLLKGKVFDAIFEGLTNIAVMLCGLMLVLGLSIPSLHILIDIAKYLFIVSVIAIWATSGRRYSDAFLGRVLWGFYGVYELTGIFGDLLSYARLFALGLASGIIGTAINEIAPVLLTGIHFNSIGGGIYAVIMIILFLIVVVVGHLFTMMIGILGAFVHTMRLQFVEFFGKFFEGGGVAFRPFQIQSKYFSIKKSEEKTIKE